MSKSDERKAYLRLYMNEYNFCSPMVECLVCGVFYKKAYRYKHIRTKNHIEAGEFNTSFKTLKDI